MNISDFEFRQNMETVGNVRHENVVPLRAYFSSKDERLMLYDYYTKGSVYELLHGQFHENRGHVNWETRLKVAIGAAKGIAEIHTKNGGKLVHGNIKASNVFVNSRQYGCISDLGLAKMIATTFVPTAWCYAPEVNNITRNVSQASDVYGFGILILELLTRKSPVYVYGGPEAVDLVKLVASVKNKRWAAKVFDIDLLNQPTLEEPMVKMLHIGLTRVAKSSNKRPKMSEVVKMLEDSSLMSTGTPASLQPKLVFIEDDCPTFDLKDMLMAQAEVLKKGTFGTSYKAILENGKTIVVKRLKDVDATLEEFQQHMEIIGKMRHEDVARLMAYYFSVDKKLLVYDYYHQCSLSALLHGAGRKHLDWKTRLKIAVGAARGIAYIHRQSGRKLVHGNIKASNIFLSGQQNTLVSDAGLAILMSPTIPSKMLIPGYCAPEVADIRNVSQASDVYSFGVVLLKLISGKPSLRTFNGETVSLVKWVQSVSCDKWPIEVVDLKLPRCGNDVGVVQLLQIALDCVATDPEQRPKMSKLVKILVEISGIYTGDRPSMESRLENVLEDLLPTLLP